MTERAWFMDTVQLVPLTLLQPLQEPNLEPPAALALNVTNAPTG